MRRMNYAQEIKERLSVVDVLSRYGFEPDGHGFLLCPFHQEKTPSFRVYDSGKRWYCFGCGERGDVIDLVRKLFRLSFQQAVIRMDDDFNLGLLRQGKEDTRRREAEIAQMAAQRREQEKLKLNYDGLYNRNLLLYRMLCEAKEKSRPLDPGRNITPEFARLLHRMDELEAWLDENITFDKWKEGNSDWMKSSNTPGTTS